MVLGWKQPQVKVLNGSLAHIFLIYFLIQSKLLMFKPCIKPQIPQFVILIWRNASLDEGKFNCSNEEPCSRQRGDHQDIILKKKRV